MRSLQKWSPSKTFKVSEGGPSENSKKGGPSENAKKGEPSENSKKSGSSENAKKGGPGEKKTKKGGPMQEAKGYFLQGEEQGAGIPFNGEPRHSNTSAKTKMETGTDI